MYTHVRWSGSTARSSSLHVVVDDPLVRRAEALEDRRPARRRSASSTASLMSDSTQLAWVWATSSGPVAPAAAVANSWPSIEPHAGLDRVDAEPGPGEVEERQRRQHDAVDALVGAQQRAPCARARAASRARRRAPRRARRPRRRARSAIVGVHVVERVGRLVDVVERRRRPARGRRSGGGPCAGSGAGSARSPRSVSAVTCSAPPGPSPTTTTERSRPSAGERRRRRRRRCGRARRRRRRSSSGSQRP